LVTFLLGEQKKSDTVQFFDNCRFDFMIRGVREVAVVQASPLPYTSHCDPFRVAPVMAIVRAMIQHPAE
jgi:hypothetical protein